VAVRIRLKRMGAKNRPFYRLVVADSRTGRDGRTIEEIGYYDPTTDPATVSVKQDRAVDWLRKGAQPSDTAKALLQKSGAWRAWQEESSQSS